MLLYHGSAYKHHQLEAGFHHTKELKLWDSVESNEWLYAFTARDEALRQGFYSTLEQYVKVDHIGYANRCITVTLAADADRRLVEQDVWGPVFDRLGVFLYCLDCRREDGWVKNNNPENNVTTEWKTRRLIQAAQIRSVRQIRIAHWLFQQGVPVKFQ